MRITLTDSDGNVQALKETEGKYAETETACACGSKLVGGTGRVVDGHDVYRADGLCAQCREPRGVIRAKVETIFGVEEDERVLMGRCRVY